MGGPSGQTAAASGGESLQRLARRTRDAQVVLDRVPTSVAASPLVPPPPHTHTRTVTTTTTTIATHLLLPIWRLQLEVKAAGTGTLQSAGGLFFLRK